MRFTQRIAAAMVLSTIAAQAAATRNTTLTVTNATLTLGPSSVTIKGPCALTNIGTCIFSASAPNSTFFTASGGINAPYIITLDGSVTGEPQSFGGLISIPRQFLRAGAAPVPPPLPAESSPTAVLPDLFLPQRIGDARRLFWYVEPQR